MATESRPAWVRRMTGPFLRLQGSNCQECLVVHFPARKICPDCGHDDTEKPQTREAEGGMPSPKIENPVN